MEPSGADVTMLLSELTQGNEAAAERLVPLVYDELKRLANGYMRRERPDHTLQATALVHEAYLKLVRQQSVKTVKRDWSLAKAWLSGELRQQSGDSA
jgi:DNA-directed RNA polymerase specialized sigma24 family protein